MVESVRVHILEVLLTSLHQRYLREICPLYEALQSGTARCVGSKTAPPSESLICCHRSNAAVALFEKQVLSVIYMALKLVRLDSKWRKLPPKFPGYVHAHYRVPLYTLYEIEISCFHFIPGRKDFSVRILRRDSDEELFPPVALRVRVEDTGSIAPDFTLAAFDPSTQEAMQQVVLQMCAELRDKLG